IPAGHQPLAENRMSAPRKRQHLGPEGQVPPGYDAPHIGMAVEPRDIGSQSNVGRTAEGACGKIDVRGDTPCVIIVDGTVHTDRHSKYPRNSLPAFAFALDGEYAGGRQGAIAEIGEVWVGNGTPLDDIGLGP